MEKYRIKINGKAYEVEIEELGESSSDATEKPEQISESAAKKTVSSQGSDNAHSVSAPMPGTIVDIKVKEGDVVKSGQVMLVLEAMKMENEIVAPKDGKVVMISTSKGVAVSSGEKLLDIA